MSFAFKKARMYHLPHNAIRVDEFNFLIQCLDTSRGAYTAKELQKLFFIEEVVNNKFAIFHPIPAKNFSDLPSDVRDLTNKLKSIKKRLSAPQGMDDSLFKYLKKNIISSVVDKMVSDRHRLFTMFKSNPVEYIDDIFALQYKPTKTWRGNWAETTRDYIQFLAYCGILPCYFKGLNNLERGEKFFISALGKEYINKNLTLTDIILKYKYKNALIDLEKYPKYNIRLRPFYITLELLDLAEKHGIGSIEGNLLAATISCMNDEQELENAFEQILYIIRKKNGEFTTDTNFKKEADRFLLLIKPYLLEEGLIECTKFNNKRCFKITRRGINALLNEPKNVIFFGDYIGPYAYTPIIGFLLKHFASLSRNKKKKINISTLIENKSILYNIINKKKLLDIITTLHSTLEPSPIKKIKGDLIFLNDLSCQYSVNSGTDFTTLHDSDFVEGYEIKPKDSEIRKIDLHRMVPEAIINEMYNASISSNGDRYESAINLALQDLLGAEYVKHYGSRFRGHRISDIVWKVPVVYDNLEKQLLVIIETKSGNAIRTFDERKEIDDIKKTIARYRRDLPIICGIWVFIIDGENLPSHGRHGGFRGEGLSFKEKLTVIQQKLNLYVQRPVLITAFNISSFIEYYKYLYIATRNFGVDFKNINEISVNQFWVWGSLFKPIETYYNYYNDSTEIRKGLIQI